jgi:RNA polymerase sigma-70 factor, ECF subfamily
LIAPTFLIIKKYQVPRWPFDERFKLGQRITTFVGSNLTNRMVTDEEGILISRSKNGDWDAFAALIQSNQRMIYSLAYRMSGSASDAEDLAQETFIRAFQGLNSYRGTAKFSSWLYRIALNLSLRWRKREGRRGIADSEWVAADVKDRAADSRSERVQEALLLLSPKQRAAVILTIFDGMTHSEAAAVLGCAEKTLSWRLFVARRRLAQLLKDFEKAP